MDDIKTIKSEDFALEIIKLYNYLSNEKSEYVISKQILRSGTSIGANIAEANCAESDSDFVHKLSIAQKEAAETNYWLKLLYKSSFIDEDKYSKLSKECNALLRILSTIIFKIKNKEKS